MSDPTEPPPKRRRDIDISRSSMWDWPTLRIDWFWLALCLIAFVFYYLFSWTDWNFLWILAILPGAALLYFAIWATWNLVIRRGIFTWMRLAKEPARLYALGDTDGAERAFQRALERARRFAPADRRRGFMLIQLAMYVKLQGRYAESKPLFEESVEILANHQYRDSMEYFITLNNYAIYHIHLRNHAEALRMTETAIAQILLAGKQAESEYQRALLKPVEFLLHMNLVFLCLEMGEPAEAQQQLAIADELFAELPRHSKKIWHDHFVSVRALVYCAAGMFADAEDELASARDPAYYACHRARSRLQLIRREFAAAEASLRKFFEEERKRGPLHRPEFRDANVHLAEALYGQGRHEEAFAALREALRLVADFELPSDDAWRQTLAPWLQRAREQGKEDVRAALEAELLRTSTSAEEHVKIIERLRVPPR
jgi:tetratricopeptide (TPR) repeat protein